MRRDEHMKKPVFYPKLIALLLFACSYLLTGCMQSPSEMQISESQPIFEFPKYAKGFRVNQTDTYYEIVIFDPYTTDNVLQRCYLMKKDAKLPAHAYPDIILSEIDKVLAMSATQWGPFLMLGKESMIKGISEAGFVQNSRMKELLKSGEVIEVASDAHFKLELISNLAADIILVSPDARGLPHQLVAAGFPLLAWTDYFETDPLGRAEWLRLIGLLSGTSALADSLFQDIEQKYLSLKESASRYHGTRPKLFADKEFAGQWYVPAGESYLAKIFADAGADYVFSDLSGTASIPMDIETIIKRAADADYWRIAHAARASYGYEDLEKENELYAGFAAFKNKKVIFCNISQTAYFEESTLYPHHLLADFIAIFQPELMPDYQPVYHELMK